MKNKLIDFESITAIILSFIGGLLDVYCLFNFDMYGMLHTGNIIKQVVYLIDGNYDMFLATLFIIISFAIGIFLANLFDDKVKNKTVSGLLAVTIILLAIIIFIPNDKEAGNLSYIKFIAALLFGLEGAFMLYSFARFGEYSYSATTMTANINRFVSNLYERVVKKDKTKGYSLITYLLIFVLFCLGVGVGYVYLKFMPIFDSGFMGLYEYNFILLLPLTLLIVILVVEIKRNKTFISKGEEKNV